MSVRSTSESPSPHGNGPLIGSKQGTDPLDTAAKQVPTPSDPPSIRDPKKTVVDIASKKIFMECNSDNKTIESISKTKKNIYDENTDLVNSLITNSGIESLITITHKDRKQISKIASYRLLVSDESVIRNLIIEHCQLPSNLFETCSELKNQIELEMSSLDQDNIDDFAYFFNIPAGLSDSYSKILNKIISLLIPIAYNKIKHIKEPDNTQISNTIGQSMDQIFIYLSQFADAGVHDMLTAFCTKHADYMDDEVSFCLGRCINYILSIHDPDTKAITTKHPDISEEELVDTEATFLHRPSSADELRQEKWIECLYRLTHTLNFHTVAKKTEATRLRGTFPLPEYVMKKNKLLISKYYPSFDLKRSAADLPSVTRVSTFISDYGLKYRSTEDDNPIKTLLLMVSNRHTTDTSNTTHALSLSFKGSEYALMDPNSDALIKFKTIEAMSIGVQAYIASVYPSYDAYSAFEIATC